MRDSQKDLGDERRALVPSQSAAIAQLKGDNYGPQGYGQPPGEEETDLAVVLRQYLYMVLKRKWLILGTALVFTVLGSVFTLLKTPLYSASVRIQIEREPAKILEGGTTSPTEAGTTDFLRTQYELIKSRAMAERVVSMQRLYDDEGFFKPRDVSALGLLGAALFSSSKKELPLPTARQGWAVGIVLSNVAVLPVANSRLVDVRYSDPSAVRAQQIANGYADAYIASNLDKRFEANSYAKTFLDDQIKQLKIRMEEAEKALLVFAEQEKMVEVSDKASIAENNLAAANAALGQLISERIKNEQLWRQLEGSTAINLPQLLSNPVIEVLRGQRKALETVYQEKLENFKPSFPTMVQISNKIKEIDRQLAAEVKTIRNSLKAAYETSLAQESEMKGRIETLRGEVLDLQKKGIQYNILKREVETNRGLYNSLLQRSKEVNIAGGVGTNNIFIVDRALVPDAPSEPNFPRALLISLALGLGAGVGISFLLEMLDDRVRTPEEIEQLSALSTLGIIPRQEFAEGLDQALKDPRSAIAEAYRSLATTLQFSTESGLPRSIAVTSAGPGEGKSTTSVAIARHFAQMGHKVLLIDADLRNPSLHKKLCLNNVVGLTNYLTGQSLPPEVLQRTDHPNLAFMASGPLPPNAADLLSGTRLYSLVSLGGDVFDLIVFDAPPLLGLADAQLLANASAGTIFVIAAGEKGKGMIRSALRRLQLARITLLGAVLTKFDSKAVGYNYGYGYGYEYGQSAYTYGNSTNAKPQLAKPGLN
ncbi:polysaccharide biosynthesis tyrosine autokinase [Rhodomicrobium vannielii ATCC 17100]|uniref:GumC family protein n=1 Tax=Rhodomicrobium vannielii TaxID=1069 RepID=UPI001917D2D0|nr:polysaccharide biosynthesis tyrosine autokinase [Rhodomicrobium vannielii]MBJ7532843.1 polysaccharide biosynthesis tyrosine autokinase [Rhodomicrobium vannielii ATCC 17100]